VRRVLASLLAVTALAGCGSSGGHVATTAPASGPAEQAVNGPPPVVHVPPSHAAVPVLMYHVVKAPPPGVHLPGLWVSGDAFRAQVAALAAAGFQGVTLDRVLDAWRGRATLPPHPIVFSFDDGYLSQGTTAADALRARHWPGVLNLVLHALDEPGGLSTGRIRAMIAAGWEVDAHTIDHLDLTTLDAAALRHQVAGSRVAIRHRFGVPVDAFCYPAGKFDAAVEAAVRAAGFRAATTELPGAAKPGDDRFALPRIRVDGSDSTATVLAYVRAALGGPGHRS
jgi:peptidoglycan/xylan/chitin deacetylase (PgdA/CDA1 family)